MLHHACLGVFSDMRRRPGPWPARTTAAVAAIVAGGVVCAVARVAAAEDHTRSVFEPASPSATAIYELFLLVLAVAAAIFVIFAGTLVYSIIRFRTRGEEPPDEEPPQIYGSQAIELAWTIGPLLIVLALFLIVVRNLAQTGDADRATDALGVRVVAHQWWWDFQYPQYGFSAPNELHIPTTDKEQSGRVRLRLDSADVVHSFWVPRLAGKTDVIPGHENTMVLQTAEPGVYHGQCAEYCGMQHAGMLIRVVAEPRADFEAWVKAQQQPAVEDPSVAKGWERFLANACVNCHTVRGTPADGTFGPDLTHLMSRKTIGAGVAENNEENLLKWVTDPQTVKPGCHMPSMHLPPEDVQTIVSYLSTLR